MQPDGSYIQRRPADGDSTGGSHCQLIEYAEKRVKLHRKNTKKRVSSAKTGKV
jgi:polyphosphate kinase